MREKSHPMTLYQHLLRSALSRSYSYGTSLRFCSLHEVIRRTAPSIDTLSSFLIYLQIDRNSPCIVEAFDQERENALTLTPQQPSDSKAHSGRANDDHRLSSMNFCRCFHRASSELGRNKGSQMMCTSGIH